MYFSILVPNIEKSTHNTSFWWCCSVPQYSDIHVFLAFWYRRSWKTIITHVSVNIVSFPHIGWLSWTLVFCYLTTSKQWRNTFFGNVVLFLYKECYIVLAFWYGRSSKPLKRRVFDNVLFSHIVCFQCFYSFFCG